MIILPFLFCQTFAFPIYEYYGACSKDIYMNETGSQGDCQAVWDLC